MHLGPGYRDRIPSGSRWRKIEIDHEHVILEHTCPEQWFETRFSPIPHDRASRRSFTVPDVLTRARSDLAPILFTPDLAVGQ
jgi:hypothetical protein